MGDVPGSNSSKASQTSLFHAAPHLPPSNNSLITIELEPFCSIHIFSPEQAGQALSEILVSGAGRKAPQPNAGPRPCLLALLPSPWSVLTRSKPALDRASALLDEVNTDELGISVGGSAVCAIADCWRVQGGTEGLKCSLHQKTSSPLGCQPSWSDSKERTSVSQVQLRGEVGVTTEQAFRKCLMEGVRTLRRLSPAI